MLIYKVTYYTYVVLKMTVFYDKKKEEYISAENEGKVVAYICDQGYAINDTHGFDFASKDGSVRIEQLNIINL